MRPLESGVRPQRAQSTAEETYAGPGAAATERQPSDTAFCSTRNGHPGETPIFPPRRRTEVHRGGAAAPVPRRGGPSSSSSSSSSSSVDLRGGNRCFSRLAVDGVRSASRAAAPGLQLRDRLARSFREAALVVFCRRRVRPSCRTWYEWSLVGQRNRRFGASTLTGQERASLRTRRRTPGTVHPPRRRHPRPGRS